MCQEGGRSRTTTPYLPRLHVRCGHRYSELRQATTELVALAVDTWAAVAAQTASANGAGGMHSRARTSCTHRLTSRLLVAWRISPVVSQQLSSTVGTVRLLLPLQITGSSPHVCTGLQCPMVLHHTVHKELTYYSQAMFIRGKGRDRKLSLSSLFHFYDGSSGRTLVLCAG